MALSFREYIKQLYGDMYNQASPLGSNETGRLFEVFLCWHLDGLGFFLTKMHFACKSFEVISVCWFFFFFH